MVLFCFEMDQKAFCLQKEQMEKCEDGITSFPHLFKINCLVYHILKGFKLFKIGWVLQVLTNCYCFE